MNLMGGALPVDNRIGCSCIWMSTEDGPGAGVNSLLTLC